MPVEIVTIPCLQDNYAFLMHNPETGETALFDAPEAEPIARALTERDWGLDHILLTHHHADHVEGVAQLRASTGAKVIGAAADAHRLPPLDIQVKPGEIVTVAGESGEVIDVSGHTVGHIAYYFPGAKAAFTADSLMAFGCGRVFEGTAEQMWASLMRLAALPDDTMIYSGHEYTQTNARFALTIEAGNVDVQARADAVAEARAKGKATVPTRLVDEKATNPFLRANNDSVKAALGMKNASDVAVFAEIRGRKDRF